MIIVIIFSIISALMFAGGCVLLCNTKKKTAVVDKYPLDNKLKLEKTRCHKWFVISFITVLISAAALIILLLCDVNVLFVYIAGATFITFLIASLITYIKLIRVKHKIQYYYMENGLNEKD